MNIYRINYQLNDIIFNDLKNLAINLSYQNYTTLKGTKISLQYSNCLDSANNRFSVVKQIEELINPRLDITMAVFIKFPAYSNIEPHIDDNIQRSSCVTWALHPDLQNFAPVNFHDINKEIVETVFYDKFPIILNTRAIHSVQNNNFDRYTFQLCFSNSIDELANFNKDHKIFIK